jgi:hypothetical protein
MKFVRLCIILVSGLIIASPFVAVSNSYAYNQSSNQGPCGSDGGDGDKGDHWHHPPCETRTTTVTTTVSTTVTTTETSVTKTTAIAFTSTQPASSLSTGSSSTSTTSTGSLFGSSPAELIVTVNVSISYSELTYLLPVSNVYGTTTSSFYESIVAQYGGVPYSYLGYYYGSFAPISGCQQGINDTITITVLGQMYTKSAACPAQGHTAYINFTLS